MHVSLDKLNQIEQRFQVLQKHHGLSDWNFRWDHSRKRGGCCFHQKKVISLSKYFVMAASDADIEDTLLHEIAHALVGQKHGHGPVWKKKALEIGCSAQRCHRVEITKAPFLLRCKKGCWSVPRFRRTLLKRMKHLHCAECQSALEYVES